MTFDLTAGQLKGAVNPEDNGKKAPTSIAGISVFLGETYFVPVCHMSPSPRLVFAEHLHIHALRRSPSHSVQHMSSHLWNGVNNSSSSSSRCWHCHARNTLFTLLHINTCSHQSCNRSSWRQGAEAMNLWSMPPRQGAATSSNFFPLPVSYATGSQQRWTSANFSIFKIQPNTTNQ